MNKGRSGSTVLAGHDRSFRLGAGSGVYKAKKAGSGD